MLRGICLACFAAKACHTDVWPHELIIYDFAKQEFSLLLCFNRVDIRYVTTLSNHFDNVDTCNFPRVYLSINLASFTKNL